MKTNRQRLLVILFLFAAMGAFSQENTTLGLNTNLGLVTDDLERAMFFNAGVEVPLTKRIHFAPSLTFGGFDDPLLNLEVRYYFTIKSFQWYAVFGPSFSCSGGCGTADYPFIGAGLNVELNDRIRFNLQARGMPDLVTFRRVFQAGLSFSLTSTKGDRWQTLS